MPDPQPPGRRPYKRFAPQVWNEHKDTIRKLFLEQGKTHEEVTTILKEHHSLDIGVRQLKRKTDEWGFFRNVPNHEKEKMIRTQQRRQEQLGRPTKFLRKQRDGEFWEVPAAKLDAYQKRFGFHPNPSLSESSGLPSNIMCQTPSNYTQAPHGFAPTTPVARSSDEMALEFNNFTEHIFNDTHNSGMASPMRPRQNSDEPIGEAWSRYQLAEDAKSDAFEGSYKTAAIKYESAARKAACCRNWIAVVCQFKADLMKAACYPGCPQSLATRVADILSRFLVREREKYSNSNSEISNETELCKVLSGIKLSARFWGSVLVQQRALQIWEPILGQDHAEMVLLRDILVKKRYKKPRNLDSGIHLIEPADILDLPLEIGQLAPRTALGDLLHLGDAPADRLLEKFQAIESSSISGQKIRREIALLRHGRSKALLGVYNSFLNRFGDAEKAFQDSERYMEYESCIEIKLHRMLWHAEHRTRVLHWDVVGRLICQAHEIFMAANSPSEFIIEHFPRRFKLLCLAVSAQTPVDKITSETDCVQTGTHYSGSPSHDGSGLNQSSPAAATSVLSPERLFPCTPRGGNARIDIDAWRRFVHFTPAAATPTQVTSID